MFRRYLFGPSDAAYAEQNLAAERESGRCRCFGDGPSLDLAIGHSDRWEDVLGRLPGDWRPDFVVLQLQYTTIPVGLLAAPVPLVGLAGDFNLLWHGYRRLLPRLDLVLSDTAGVEVMRRAGMTHGRQALLFGGGRSLVEADWPAGERDVDILFVGNMHPAIHQRRMRCLGRLAALAGRWNVLIRGGVFGEEYRRLLARLRIVFNLAVRGECNMRVAEAVAAGALLFQEADNREVPGLLRDGAECVYYRDEDLEHLLERYLADEAQRARVAAAARARLGELSFARQWEEQLERIEEDWGELCARAAIRTPKGSQRLAGGRAPARPPESATDFGSTPKGSQRLAGGRAPARPPESEAAFASTPKGNAVNDLFGRKMRNLRGPCRRRRNFGAVSALEKHAKSRKLPHENRSRRCPKGSQSPRSATPSGSVRRNPANRWSSRGSTTG